ncbi:uncharacterized protein LOC132363388 [Balaenoptera ricei]|uniref:uncharacterized protein LOC132363388 n=1 Tax=Balaenoptera ricei TaxID=2746895 RepID=UPI0028BE1A98|nr:uncharacterized protein LOC132363388 [Balaenoptera ricei]
MAMETEPVTVDLTAHPPSQQPTAHTPVLSAQDQVKHTRALPRGSSWPAALMSRCLHQPVSEIRKLILINQPKVTQLVSGSLDSKPAFPTPDQALFSAQYPASLPCLSTSGISSLHFLVSMITAPKLGLLQDPSPEEVSNPERGLAACRSLSLHPSALGPGSRVPPEASGRDCLGMGMNLQREPSGRHGAHSHAKHSATAKVRAQRGRRLPGDRGCELGHFKAFR